MKEKVNMLTAVILTASLFAGVTVADLTGHWKLDETSGTTANDFSGNENTGQLSGGLSFDKNSVEGFIGNALYLDGQNNYICAKSLSIPINAFTIALWFTPDSNLGGDSRRMYLVYWGGPVRPYGDKPYIVFNKSGKGDIQLVASVEEKEVSVVTTTNSWKAFTWYHIAGTYDGNFLKIYVNGKLENSAALSGKHYASSKLYLGIRSDLDLGFNGKFDDIRIYDGALDENEIKKLYNLSPQVREFIGSVQKAKTFIRSKEHKKAKDFLEKKIYEYEKWKQENPTGNEIYGETLPSELYFLSGKAKELLGAPKKDVVEMYKGAISTSEEGGGALVWLSKNLPSRQYTEIVKTFVQSNPKDYRNIIKQFELNGDWAAFNLFLNAVFSEVKSPLSTAKSIGNSLKGSAWENNYPAYCKSRAQLREYAFGKDYETAEEYINKENFQKAVEVYKNILRECDPNQDKSGLELKICRCILNAGEYQNAIAELDHLITKNKSIDKSVAEEATLIKGRCYIQLGKIDEALEVFSTLLKEYPESEYSYDTGFYIGYCYLLKNKLEQAIEAFNAVIQKHPQSSSANKARMCLRRVKNTTH